MGKAVSRGSNKKPTRQPATRKQPPRSKRRVTFDDSVIGADNLTNKQRAWCEYYLTCWNATEAARRAHYKDPENSGYDNHKKPECRAYIDRRLKELTLSANEVLARLSDEANGSLDFFLKGQRLDFDKARKLGKMHLLKSFSVGPRGWRIELYDAQAAKQLIGKHYGLFNDRNTSLTIDVSSLTNEQLERIAKGDDPVRVLADTSPSGTGTTPTPELPSGGGASGS